MTKELFLERIKELGLNKKEFAVISKVPYSTINNWGTMVNNKPLVIPVWVEPFLDYYEKATKLDYVMDEICSKIKDIRE